MSEKHQKIVSTLRWDLIRLVVVLFAAFLMAANIQTFVNTGGLYPGGATGNMESIARIPVSSGRLTLCLAIIPGAGCSME